VRTHKESGFTLIELLIIVSILGILAMIVVLGVVNAVDSSAITACKADYKTVETAQEAYRGQVGTSATSFTDLEAQQPGLNGHLVGPWLKEAPTNKSYSIGFVAGSNDIGVAVLPSHALTAGNTNCSYA
jgi:prepilin-type N-terminal cleavage/methylation domain-containing protein